MPQRFLEVQPAVSFDDLDVAAGVDAAGVAGAAALAAAAEALQRPPDLALYLLAAAVALRLVHAGAVFVGTRRFVRRSKLE